VRSIFRLFPSSFQYVSFSIALLFLGSISWAGTFDAFGPKTYERQRGRPVAVTDSFSILNPNTQYTLRVEAKRVDEDHHKDSDEGDPRATARIFLNGREVISAEDFEEHDRHDEDDRRGHGRNHDDRSNPVLVIQKSVHLQVNNQISVEVRGRRGTSVTVTVIGVDNDAPLISASAKPAANSFAWNNTDVLVTFTCSDKTSGIASCSPPVTVSKEGANQIITGTAVDKAGNTASTSITINLDKTPPVVVSQSAPAANSANWNNTAVTVSFVCSDALSGVATCSSPVTLTNEGANQIVSGTAVDKAGNQASTTATINIDKTPPVISIATPANNTIVSTPALQVTGTVTDALSGVASVSCNGTAAVFQGSGFNCSLTLTQGLNNIAVSATDVAGNTASQSISVTFVPISITDFTPKSAPVGTLVSLTGTNLTVNGNPQVILTQQGGGTIAAALTAASATSLSFVIPAGATTGKVTVSSGAVSAVSTDSLKIVARSSFGLTVGPANANALQGKSAVYTVTLTSADGFSQLADLAVSGLPSGVTASFSPPRMTAGQIATLTVSAPLNQPVGSSNLTIAASATVDGISSSQSASATLTVQPVTTSLIGRTVESDTIETPIEDITITLLGVDDTGHKTGCSGQTLSDAGGNFAFSNLPTACVGRQLVAYNGNTATDGEKYASVNLAYTVTSGQVTGPELVHLPRIDNGETKLVKQNSPTDQIFTFSTMPGVSVTVYAGTIFTLPDGTQPDPFPLVGVQVPVDRLPDTPIDGPGSLRAFIIAFQPADTTTNQPVAVTFPNSMNTPPGVNMELHTLDPVVGELVKYGTGTVSGDGTQIVPDLDPNSPGHRFGIVHFDWHGPLAPGPNGNNPTPDPNGPQNGDPIDPASGLYVSTVTDIAIGNARGLAIIRTYRTLSGTPGPFGVGTNHNYGFILDTQNFIRGTGGLLNLLMPDGNQYPFVQQPDGSFGNSTIPSLQGATITPSFDRTQYTLRFKTGTTYVFHISSQGFLTAYPNSISDPNGNTIILTHGNSERPIQITQMTDPVGRQLNLAYDDFDRITSITDAIGRSVRYEYNSQGTLAAFTNVEGGITRYAYDDRNRLISVTDPRGITYLRNSYDQNGKVVQQVDGSGGITTLAYTLLNPNLTVTEGGGSGGGAVVVGAAGNINTSPVVLTTVTDPAGNRTTYHFNPQGFLIDVTNALGEKTIYARDPATNQIVQVTDPLNRVSAFAYDSFGNLTSITKLAGTPNAITTTMTYDPVFNKITSITNPLHQTVSMSYDPAGNLTSGVDPLGHQTTFSYSPAGELLSETDALGNKAQFKYANGNLVSVTDPLGNTLTQTFDAVGRLLSSTNPLGQTKTLSYDNMNRVTQLVNPAGAVTTFTYDANGNLLSLIDPLGHPTTYTYDAMDKLATRSDPLSRQESFQYDQNGNLAQGTDRGGKVTVLKYDNLNRPVFAGFGANGGSFESTISYKYDAGGRVSSLVDSISGTITESYDDLDRLISEVTPQGSVSYTYDVISRRTGMTVAGQPPISYSYDTAGRLTQVAQSTTQVNINYDTINRRSSMTLPNGISVNYTYDRDSHLIGMTYQLASKALGNITYAYDETGRRIQVGGSLAKSNLPKSVDSATYDAANELLAWNGVARTYDPNGNTLSDGVNTFVWNARNQLASINGAPAGYDGLGRRIRNFHGTAFLYDNTDAVEELAGNTIAATRMNGGLDEFFSRTDSSGTTTPITDAQRSVLELIDSNGIIQTQYSFDPFGATTATGATSSNPFQYTGREDDGNGIYYYRARYYDSSTGRFLSEDPIGFDGGINVYAYVEDDPIGHFDPTGLDGWTRFWGGVRAVGGVFEAGAGIALGAATSWTGVGAVAGGAVALHGADQALAGLRDLFTGCHHDSFTSQGLQAAGLSQSNANLVDAGISVVGSLGAGGSAQAIRAGATEAGAGLSNAERIMYYEIGQKNLGTAAYQGLENMTPVERGLEIARQQGLAKALMPFSSGGNAGALATWPTPLGAGGAGALGAAGTIGSSSQNCKCPH
jgi:RHS repeat-associated protein